MHRQWGRPVRRATFPERALQLIEELESLQAFQRKIAFLEALSGLALLYIVTARKVLPLYRIKTLPLCTPLLCIFDFSPAFST